MKQRLLAICSKYYEQHNEMIVHQYVWKLMAYQAQLGHVGTHNNYVHLDKMQHDQQDRQVASAAHKQFTFKLYAMVASTDI